MQLYANENKTYQFYNRIKCVLAPFVQAFAPIGFANMKSF